MKIKDLRKILNNLPTEDDDCEVMIPTSTDTNVFAMVGGASRDVFKKNGEFFDIHSPKYSAEENGFKENEWKEVKKNKCLSIYL